MYLFINSFLYYISFYHFYSITLIKKSDCERPVSKNYHLVKGAKYFFRS